MAVLRVALQNRCWLGVVLLLQWVPLATAGISLEFERHQYAVAAGGNGEIEVRVMIDGDDATPGRQAVPNGLFSYGFLLRFDPARLVPAASNSVMVEPALDFFGFGNGARVVQGAGFIGVKGNISPTGTAWSGTVLATLRLRFTGSPSTATPLTLELFKESPNESVFVDGTGGQLDPLVSLRPSLIASLEPPRVEWIAAAQPHARLTFSVPPGADVVVQWSPTMAQGEWKDLPGAPHNSGQYLDFTTADRRFYRLTMHDR